MRRISGLAPSLVLALAMAQPALSEGATPAVGAAAPKFSAPDERGEVVKLDDYKVRIIDEHKGTAAVTRVLIDASDGEETWGTIGVSENIIESSWEALVDSLEYAMQGRERAAAPDSKRAVTPPA